MVDQENAEDEEVEGDNNFDPISWQSGRFHLDPEEEELCKMLGKHNVSMGWDNNEDDREDQMNDEEEKEEEGDQGKFVFRWYCLLHDTTNS